jgi:hypothetical protein
MSLAGSCWSYQHQRLSEKAVMKKDKPIMTNEHVDQVIAEMVRHNQETERINGSISVS